MDYLDNLKKLQSSMSSDTQNPENSSNKDYSSGMEDFMNKTIVNVYSRTWGRLEKRLRINKLNEFIEQIKIENDFDDKKTQELSELLMHLLTTNKINKATEIKYDKDECKIMEIYGLKFESNNFRYQKKKK